MEKLTEKKNFGVPATILCVLAYLIGFVLADNLTGGLLVGLIFAVIVFGFQFDDRVKSAVKQAYIIAILINVIHFCFTLLEYFVELVTPQEFDASFVYSNNLKDLADTYDLNAFQNALQYVLKYGRSIVEVAVVIVFVIFLIQALRGREFKFGFVNKMVGDAPMFQQGRPMYQQPMSPAQPAAHGVVCPNCGKVNAPGAGFCAGCGSKLS